MMKNYMTTRNLAMNKKPEGDSAWKAATPFLEEKVVMLIYGGPGPHEASRKLNLIGQVIPSSLTHWSGQPGLPRPTWMGAAASTSCTSAHLRD
jgi:hypothetical protein